MTVRDVLTRAIFTDQHGHREVVDYMDKKTYTDFIHEVCIKIAETLIRKDAEYGGSWQKRGGVGAMMMKLRKSDRLEEQVKRHGYDVFKAIEDSAGKSEELSDTLLDDAGYAILILAEARARKNAQTKS